MKKLISIVLFAVLALPVFAQEETQEQKWTVKATAGYFPTVPVIASIFGVIFIGVATAANEDANETVDIDIPPYCSVEAIYSFNERWSAGVSSGYTGCAWKTVDKTTKEVKLDENGKPRITYFSLIPVTLEGRCNYLNKPDVKLYGSLEAGVLLSLGSEFSVVPDIQLNPIGVEFGHRFFGLAELGIGMNYTGIRGGIGYRF